MTTRHRAREVALQVLYRFDVIGSDRAESPSPSQGAADLALDLKKHFEHFQVTENLRKFAAHLIAGTLQELNQLDTVIEKNASHWKVSRMPSIDRMLLRMATYELLHLRETPASVVINEAVELAKDFGNAETPSFINGVLDSICKNRDLEPMTG